MKHLRRVLVSLLLLFLLCAPPWLAQGEPDPVDLFTTFTPDLSGQPPDGIDGVTEVTLDLTNLEQAPLFLWIQLKPDKTILATLRIFEAIEGFNQYGDPAPGNTTEDLRYVWRGAGEGYDVVIAVAFGWPAGSVIGADDHYKIVRNAFRTELQDLGTLPIVEEPMMVFPPALAPPIVPGKTPRPPLDGEVDRRVSQKALLPEQVQVDVLMVVTEEARQHAGGDPLDIDHMAPIIAEIDEAFGQTNQGYENSDMNVRIEPAGIVRLDSFDLSGLGQTDLKNLQKDLLIKTLRNQHSADVVSLVVGDYHRNSLVTYCGIAYTQRVMCFDGGPVGACDVGIAFDPYAYNIVSEGCLSKEIALSHELSHNLSCEHARDENSAPLSLAARPYAYAYSSDAGGFRTITSINSERRRTLHYSNPSVSYLGYPTGIFGESWCARVAEAAALTVSNFRDPTSKVIFVDDMETGGLETWSAIESP